MTHKQHGFGHIAVLVIIVVLGVLGLITWQFMSMREDDTPATTTTTSTNEKTENQDQPVVEEKLSANWLLRESETAAIRVPDGFNILAAEGQAFDFVLPDVPQGTLKYQAGTEAQVGAAPAKHFDLGLIVSFNEAGFNDRGAVTKKFKTYSGLEVTLKYFEQTVEPEGVDFPKGAKYLKYTVTKDSDYINIDYVYMDTGIVDIIEEMVKTASIK